MFYSKLRMDEPYPDGLGYKRGLFRTLGAHAEQEQLVGVGGGGRGLWRGVIRIEQLQHVCAGEGDVVQVRRDDRAPQGARWGRRWAEPRRGVREDERDRRRAPEQVRGRYVVDARIVERRPHRSRE